MMQNLQFYNCARELKLLPPEER